MRTYLLFLLLLSCTSSMTFTEYSQGLIEGQWKTTLALGDVNNDGLLDLAGIGRKGNATAQVWLNTGHGWKSSVTGIDQRRQCGVGVQFYDVNQDGNLDVAYAQHCGGPSVYLGDGTGSWTNHSNGLKKEGVNVLAFGDLTNDGNAELITMGAFLEEGFRIYTYDKKWNEQNTTLPKTLQGSPFSLEIMDVNDDELNDIITSHQIARIYYNKGNFTFTEKQLGVARFIHAAHLDMNEEMDYVLSGPELRIIFDGTREHNLGKCDGAVTTADVNKDGQLDILANCDPLIIALAPDWKIITHDTPPQPLGIQAGDINADGFPDVATAFASDDGKIAIFLINK